MTPLPDSLGCEYWVLFSRTPLPQINWVFGIWMGLAFHQANYNNTKSLVGRKIQMQLNEEFVTAVYCNSNGVRLFRQFVFDAEGRVFPTEYLVMP